MEDKYKAVLFRAWALRNQFNGGWDNYYFPKMGEALDKAFPEANFPEDMLPRGVKAARTKARKRA